MPEIPHVPSPPSRKIVGVIPARMASQRLPGKVLREICGRPMLAHVFERALACRRLSTLWVATDSEEVFAFCSANEMPVLMTAASHRNGTERLLEVAEKVPAEVYAGIQGDEPMITANHLDLLLEPFFENPMPQVTTLKTPLDPAEAANPNVVKVVTDACGRALYFSRAAIPFHRNHDEAAPFYKHLGLYAYSREALERYRSLPVSSLEMTEGLEQLRFLDHGIPVRVVETPTDTIGVDTEEDLQAVTRFFTGMSPGGVSE